MGGQGREDRREDKFKKLKRGEVRKIKAKPCILKRCPHICIPIRIKHILNTARHRSELRPERHKQRARGRGGRRKQDGQRGRRERKAIANFVSILWRRRRRRAPHPTPGTALAALCITLKSLDPRLCARYRYYRRLVFRASHF